MISKEFTLIVTVLTIGIGGTMALANSTQEPYTSVLLSETTMLAQHNVNKPRIRDRTEQLKQRLNLSDEQMQQLKNIREKYRPQMEQLKIQMRTQGQELSRMMQGNTSENDLRLKHQEIINLRQKMGNIRFESMLEMRQVLTTEQRQQFAQFLQQRRQRGGRNRPDINEMP